MESSFTHPSTHELFCYQFGVAAACDQERVEEHLTICGPCREALDGVERNHPAPESLGLYALDQLHFAQRNVIRLHVTGCSYCRQAVDSYRSTPAQVGEAAPRCENPVETLPNSATPVMRTTTGESALIDRNVTPCGKRGNNLQSVDVPAFFGLGGALAACLANGRRPIESYRDSLATLKTLLAELFAGDFEQRMERAAPAASHLLGLIEVISDRYRYDLSAILGDEELREFTEACGALDRGITRDLGRAAVYYLEAKGGFDARKLISGADEVFGESRDRLPSEAVHDIDQAGTCLALSLATGAAFHIVRATKTVIKCRIEALGGEAPTGYERNLRGYVRALGGMSDGGQKYRLEPLLEVRQDPVSDPEVTMTMAEAVALWATCTDAIQSIIDQHDFGKCARAKLKKLQQSA